MRKACLLAALAGACLSGCGSSSRKPLSLAGAVSKTVQAKTGQLAASVSVSQGGRSQALLAYRYAFDSAHKLLAVTADYRALARLEGLSNPAALVVRLILDRRHGLTAYMTMPGFSDAKFQARLPAGLRQRTWMKFDTAELQTAAGQAGPEQGLIAALAGASTSPLSLLDALRTASARQAGKATISGTETTQFSTTADMSKVGLLGQLAAQLSQQSAPRWSAEVWVGSDSLIRRLRLSSPLVASQGNAQVTFTFDTSALGAPLSISVPASSATFDASAVGQ